MPLPVEIVNSANATMTERSSSIVVAATSQQLMAANPARKYLFVQNPSTLTGQGIAAAETLFIRFGASAATVNTGTSIELVAGATFIMESNYVSTQAVQVIATTINHKFIAVEG